LSQYSFAKKLQSQTVIREKLCKALLYKKGARKRLVKLRSVVNFINILQAVFEPSDFKSEKKTVFFALLGSARIIAALRILIK